MTGLALSVLKLMANWPVPVLRALGWALGLLLWPLAGSRRRITLRNLELCFPDRPAAWRRQVGREVFVRFVQAWLDRAWLWEADAKTVGGRLHVVGELDQLLQETGPVVLFVPHFMGLDAAWTALALRTQHPLNTIYAVQSNAEVDAWVAQGRSRFGPVRLFQRHEGVRSIVQALKAGEWLYLLPDMDFGPDDSIWVPFFGVPAATVPSLSRFAQLGRAKVYPVVALLTPQGYEVRIHKPLADFPSGQLQADTERATQALECWIAEDPAQYYWVHKRFKTRPQGQGSLY